MGDLAYPLVSDLKREITQKYNVLTADGVALRGLFIIDKEVRSAFGGAPLPPGSVPERARAGGRAGSGRASMRGRFCHCLHAHAARRLAAASCCVLYV